MSDQSSQVGELFESPDSRSTSVEFDRMAPAYDALLDDPWRNRFVEGADFFHRRKWDLIQHFLKSQRLDPAGMDWLDVGCGRGELLGLGGGQFRVAEGCEPSREMIRHGAKARIHWQPDLDHLPFAAATYDFITAVCVFHHVPALKRPALVCEIRRLLRPGGIFCVIEHNPYNPVTRWIVAHTPVDQDAHLLSARSTLRLMRDSGIEPIHRDYFLYAPEKWYGRLRGFEQLLRNIPLGGQYAAFARKPARAGSGDRS